RQTLRRQRIGEPGEVPELAESALHEDDGQQDAGQQEGYIAGPPGRFVEQEELHLDDPQGCAETPGPKRCPHLPRRQAGCSDLIAGAFRDNGGGGRRIMTDIDAFLAARDVLMRLRDDYAAAHETFRWPRLTHFNWALDYFDRIEGAETR